MTPEEVARQIRFQPVPHLPLHLQMTVASYFWAEGRGDYEFSYVMQRRVRGGTFTLCNFHHQALREGGWTEIRHITLLMFSARKACFPTFSVTPSLSREGLLQNLLRKSSFEIDDDPEFSRRFAVRTSMPAAVRPLLTSAVRNTVMSSGGLPIFAHGRNIIIHPTGLGRGAGMRPSLGSRQRIVTSRAIAPAEWPNFLSAAAKVANTIRKSEVETRSSRPSPAEFDLREAATNGGPGLGILPREEIDQFLECQTPRTVSKPIQRATSSRLAPFLRLIGGILIVIPSLLTCVFWLAGFPFGRVISAVIFVAGILCGGAFFVVPALKRHRRLSLLKHGTCLTAKIAHIQPVELALTVGQVKYQRYDVTLRYSLDGTAYQIDVSTYCDQAKRAAMLSEGNGRTRILVSTGNAWRIFWIDGLIC